MEAQVPNICLSS